MPQTMNTAGLRAWEVDLDGQLYYGFAVDSTEALRLARIKAGVGHVRDPRARPIAKMPESLANDNEGKPKVDFLQTDIASPAAPVAEPIEITVEDGDQKTIKSGDQTLVTDRDTALSDTPPAPGAFRNNGSGGFIQPQAAEEEQADDEAAQQRDEGAIPTDTDQGRAEAGVATAEADAAPEAPAVPRTEAARIRSVLRSEPNLSNRDVVARLKRDGVTVTSSQVTAIKKTMK